MYKVPMEIQNIVINVRLADINTPSLFGRVKIG